MAQSSDSLHSDVARAIRQLSADNHFRVGSTLPDDIKANKPELEVYDIVRPPRFRPCFLFDDLVPSFSAAHHSIARSLQSEACKRSGIDVTSTLSIVYHNTPI